ncbi:hypothetical protein IJI31_06505 [bacterium]|nr:hypothetical protein [bacterium]
MSCIVDENGNIEVVQGDSFKLYVDGINTDENYKVYFAIYDSNGNQIGDQVYVQSNYQPTVILQIPASLTDNLVVTTGINGTEEYYYGIKVCLESTGFEDTQCIGNSDIGELNTITVYPKKVEGI